MVMIVRTLRLRHGRFALPRTSNSIRSWRRFASTEQERSQSVPNPFESNGHTNLTATSEIAVEDQVKKDWEFFQFQKAATNHLGTQIAPHYKPRDLIANPPAPSDITLELLMASQTHLGHHTSLWHPGNARYIFGIRGSEDPIHVISLDVTAAHLRRACKIVQGVTERGGLVLFVGSRAGQARAVVKAAEMAKGCHLFSRWIPGSITNGQQILGKCSMKVVNELDEEVPGFEEQLHLAAAIKPDLVICLNPLENYVLLHECGLNNIPTIGIIDTDCNPAWVTYPIPANDDSLRSVFMIAGALGRAGQQGQEIRLENAKAGSVDYHFEHGLTEPTPEERAAYEARQSISSAQAHRYDEFEDVEENELDNEILEDGMSALKESKTSDIDQSLLTEQKLESWKEQVAQVPGWGASSRDRSSSREWQEGQGTNLSDFGEAAQRSRTTEQGNAEPSVLEESGLQAEYKSTPPRVHREESTAIEQPEATSQNSEAESHNILPSHEKPQHQSSSSASQLSTSEDAERAAREMQVLEKVKQAAAQELPLVSEAITTTQTQPSTPTTSTQRSLPESSGDVEFQATTSTEQQQQQQQTQRAEAKSAPAEQPLSSREQDLLAREQEMQQRWEEMVRRERALQAATAQKSAQPVEQRSVSESAGDVEYESSAPPLPGKQLEQESGSVSKENVDDKGQGEK